MFPLPRNFPESLSLCNVLRGSLAVATSPERADLMRRILSQYTEQCPGEVWSGFSDILEEGKFVDVNTGAGMEWSNWNWAEPNGGRVENCATLTKDFMNDNSCEG